MVTTENILFCMVIIIALLIILCFLIYTLNNYLCKILKTLKDIRQYIRKSTIFTNNEDEKQ